jgi:hypothetical protein
LSNSPKLTQLNCGTNRIVKLGGIDSLKSLSYLDCHSNQLIVLAGFNSIAPLKAIDARSNKLKALPKLSQTNYNNLNTSKSCNFSENNIGFLQVDTALKNINAINKFSIFNFNTQTLLTFKNGLIVEFDPEDTVSIKLNYTPYKGDRFIWRFRQGVQLPDSTPTIFRKLSVKDTGSYSCEVQNTKVLPYSQMTLLSVNLKLKLKVNICPDIRNIQLVTNSNICEGKNELAIKGYKSDYVYTLTNWKTFTQVIATDSVINNLSEGRYKLTINNKKGNCQVDTTNYQFVVIKDVSASNFITDVKTATCSNKGEVIISNPNVILEYKLLNTATNQVSEASNYTFSNLKDGNYKLVVSDLQGTCIDTSTRIVEIKSLLASNYALSVSPFTCSNKGEAFITNFNQAYTYKLIHTKTNQSFVASQAHFNNLPDGNYIYLVDNQLGTCVDTLKLQQYSVKSLKASDYDLNITSATCLNKGEVIISNYDYVNKYLLLHTDGTPYASVNNVFSKLKDGEYTFIVKNAQNTCIDTLNTEKYSISSLQASNFSLEKTNASCFDDGKVQVTSNYNPSYWYYLINSKNGNTIVSVQGEFTNLKPGEYYFSVHNQNATCRDTLKFSTVEIKAAGNCGEEITPNGDGINDNLTILESGASKIFDRNGVLIAELNTPAEWDCKNKNGQYVTSGVYMLYINDQFIKAITVFR